MNSPRSAPQRLRSATRCAAAGFAVVTLTLFAPLATGAASAHALGSKITVSGQATITTTCNAGGESIIALGVGDQVDGTIEIVVGQPGKAGGVYVPTVFNDVAGVKTGAPAAPFHFTTPIASPVKGCVEVPGMTLTVTYTVTRGPLGKSIEAPVEGLRLAQ